jgi:hypothetical protein
MYLIGNGTLTLPESYANLLPAVAWTIPDVVCILKIELRVLIFAQDAMATVTFRNTTDLACLMASISNGVTIQTPSVPWTTGGVTMGIIIISGLISISGTLGSATNATTGSTTTPLSAPDIGSSLAPQVNSASSWSGSNIPTPMSPVNGHSPLVAGQSTHSGGGEGFALAAAGAILAAGGGGMAATAAANDSGNNTAQPRGHVETTAPSTSHGPLARMDPIVLFLHFQSISSSGLLSLRYPTIYRSFTVGVYDIWSLS